MAYLSTHIYDNGLNELSGPDRVLHICSAEPTDFGNVSVVSLGERSNPTINTPTNMSGGGREVVIDNVTDGSVTSTGTASHWALVDNTNSRLLASQLLTATQVVTNGNTFSLTSFTIGIPGPV